MLFLVKYKLYKISRLLLKQDNTINDLRDKQNSHKARNGLKTGRKLPFIWSRRLKWFDK